MKKMPITIDVIETYSRRVIVYAETLDDALNRADELRARGEIEMDSDCCDSCTVKLYGFPTDSEFQTLPVFK